MQVKVKKRGDDRKFLAKVLSIGVDCDVALLDVTDESFWEGAHVCKGGLDLVNVCGVGGCGCVRGCA